MLTNLQRAFILGLAVTCFVVGKVRADATLTCTLTGAGAANTSVPLVVSDADGVRILNAAVKSYSPVTVPPVIPANDPRCQTTITNPSPPPATLPQTPDPGCLPTFRQATNREAITLLLHDALFSTLLNGVKAGEQASAAKTAADAVVPIAPK